MAPEVALTPETVNVFLNVPGPLPGAGDKSTEALPSKVCDSITSGKDT
jgi:hypothetical protein